jgi:hypothetical protein
MDLAELNISSLAHLCRQATDRYFQQEVYDDSFCLEVFRRAIEDKDERAWAVVIEQYERLVAAWVQRHHAFPIADEETDYFVNCSFDSFWSAFSRNPKKLKKFDNLRALLQYLKLCTYTAVQSYVERRMPPRNVVLTEIPGESLEEPVNAISQVDGNMVAGIVWQYISEAVKTEQERKIAEDFLLYDLKPMEIFDRHGELFESVDQVRRVKGNFMTRLRRNQQLLAILETLD